MANPNVDQMIADITRQKTVNEAVLVYIKAVPDRIAAAVADAIAKGATEAEVQQMRDLGLAISAETVFDAINANVPPNNQLKK